MKKLSVCLLAFSLLASSIIVPGFAAEETRALSSGEVAVKHIQERATPSIDNMGLLSALTGSWKYTARVWTKEGSEPQEGRGQVMNDIVLENRFLSSSLIGNVNIDGLPMPYKGQALIGYDTTKKSFTSSWADTLGTGMITGTGTYDPKKKVITETGRFTNPISGAEEAFRAETSFAEVEGYKRTIFTTGKSGKEMKLMEFTFWRSQRL